MFKTIIHLSLFSIILALSSCGSHSKMVYFQNDEQDSTDIDIPEFRPTLKPDDFLSVIVTANDPQSAIPFNFPLTGSNTSINQGYTNGNSAKTGYLIDPNGFVNLPVLGKIKLGGLSRTEATDLLEKQLSNYLKNPVVNIQIQNFKVTVLGEVSRPGTFNIPNERITLLEAIGIAGDLSITGERNNVLVIRELEGEKKQYRIDLTTNEVLTSPVYYLQQNDVVYVEPNLAKRSQGTFWRSTGGIFISLTSLVIATITLIAK